METIKGIAVSPGVAIGPAYVTGRQQYVIPEESVGAGDVEREVRRVSQAIGAASQDILNLKNRLSGTPVDKYSAILDAHLAILNDERLFDAISRRIREHGFSAEHAVSKVLSEYAQTLESVDDVYLSQRATDIYDIQDRLLTAFMGKPDRGVTHFARPVVIVAHDLTPSETLALDREKVLGFATDAGGSTSHTAIVAKALSIPAVAGLGRASVAVAGGDTVIVDGDKGLLIVNPDPGVLERYHASQVEHAATGTGLGILKEVAADTTDGRHISLLGNIELPAEIGAALDHGAEGIGLFRTEFLFMQAGHEPSEEEQYAAYCNAARALGPRPLVIRTFDLGGEKLAGGLRHHQERNPSLGCRSIRFSFENPAIFRTQLRAILRCGIHGDVRLLLPMIASVEEVRRAKAYIAEVKDELKSEGIPYVDNMPVGIMVEVPSVAIAPDAFAKEVDFFSIGTNDLIQYTVAVERVNEHVAWLFTPAHPAILRLIKNVVTAAEAAKIPVSLCGEMGSDPVFTVYLVGVGIQELSVAPPALPRIKRLIRLLSYQDARRIADKALALSSAREITEFLIKSLPETDRPLSD